VAADARLSIDEVDALRRIVRGEGGVIARPEVLNLLEQRGYIMFISGKWAFTIKGHGALLLERAKRF
jgi:hypothetical protein